MSRATVASEYAHPQGTPVRYTHVSYHRDGTHGKSQWTIARPQERCVFWCAHDRCWLDDTCGWGLYTPDGSVACVGTAAATKVPLYVAKFVDSGKTGLWHGYPADHQRRTQDRPPEDVVARWLALGLPNLTRAKLSKLLAGKKCVLTA